MNQSELNNIATLLVAVIGPIVVKYGVSQDALAQLVPAAFAVIWGVYSHWGQKKVPADAVVVATKQGSKS